MIQQTVPEQSWNWKLKDKDISNTEIRGSDKKNHCCLRINYTLNLWIVRRTSNINWI